MVDGTIPGSIVRGTTVPTTTAGTDGAHPTVGAGMADGAIRVRCTSSIPAHVRAIPEVGEWIGAAPVHASTIPPLPVEATAVASDIHVHTVRVAAPTAAVAALQAPAALPTAAVPPVEALSAVEAARAAVVATAVEAARVAAAASAAAAAHAVAAVAASAAAYPAAEVTAEAAPVVVINS